MRVDDFDFELPERLIAQHPSPERGHSRLLRVPPEGPITACAFEEIVRAFRGDELLIVNDTRVVPARILAHKATGGAVELFVVEPAPGGLRALTRGKRLSPGQRICLPDGREAEIVARDDRGIATLRVDFPEGQDLWQWLPSVGQVPLPPYIDRAPEAEDAERYQTIYAERPGAVAAPTAGLHFTADILAALRAKGVEQHTVTLHVGLGTFQPVRVDTVEAHQMHSERFSVPPRTAEALRSGRPVVAVGTTTVRALESYARDPLADRTEIFIYPGFEFQIVDGLITNFHLPKSTLLMMVSAFAGTERVRAAYAAAIEHNLRFYSYGDASLFRRPGGRWISDFA